MNKKTIVIAAILIFVLATSTLTFASALPTVTYVNGWGTIATANSFQYSYPTAIAITGADDVYAVDTVYGLYPSVSVDEFACVPGDNSGANNYLNMFGSYGYIYSGGSGTFQQGPDSMAIDPSGNVYIVDQGHFLVQKFDSAGNFLLQWGSQDYTATGMGAFSFPSGIAVDPITGNIFVSDEYNSFVQVFDSSGNFLFQFGGNPDLANTSPFYPAGIAIDSNGNVFVVDQGNIVVQEFTDTGTFVTQWGSGTFSYPTNIAVDGNGNLFVLDAGLGQVLEFDNSGNLVTQWATTYYGSNIAVDSSGYIFVTETYYTGFSYSGVIEEFDNSGNLIAMFTGATSLPGPSQFFAPVDAAVSTSGDVYITDSANYRIQEFSASGAFIRSWGNPTPTPDYTGYGQFNYPTGIAYNTQNGYLYVSDTYNNAIQVFDSVGNFQFQFGSSNASPGSGNGELNQPVGIACDSSGNVYVVDQGNSRVEVFDANGNYLNQWSGSGGGFSSPYGIAVSAAGNVYVVDGFNNRIQEFTTAGAFVTMWGSYGTGDTNFAYPKMISVDNSGNVYVVDELNSRISVFDSNGNFLLSFGTSGAGALSYPYGIGVSAATGNIYVVDGSTTNVIKEYSQNGLFFALPESQWGSIAAIVAGFSAIVAITAVKRIRRK